MVPVVVVVDFVVVVAVAVVVVVVVVAVEEQSPEQSSSSSSSSSFRSSRSSRSSRTLNRQLEGSRIQNDHPDIAILVPCTTAALHRECRVVGFRVPIHAKFNGLKPKQDC